MKSRLNPTSVPVRFANVVKIVLHPFLLHYKIYFLHRFVEVLRVTFAIMRLSLYVAEDHTAEARRNTRKAFCPFWAISPANK